MQTLLPFFQQLLSEWYQFTLDNLVYAICLAVSVWLLTAIFYSIRIGFLNRRNRLSTKAAQQQIQQLQEQMSANKAEMEQAKAAGEQETQRAATLQERIAGLSKQLTEGIQTLAANLDAGEQFMAAADNVEAEELVQHYSASIKQLIERLRTEQKTTIEWQQAYHAGTTKLAEKDRELAALQSRVDTQSQQLAQWELIIEEHKSLLKQHQVSAEQRLAEVLQKHQSDLARHAPVEQQTRDWSNTKQQQVQLKTQDALSAPREQTRQPVEIIQIQPPPAQIEIEQIAVAEPATPETHEEQSARDVNEFFASIMQPIEQRYEGQNNSISEPELQSETDQINKESQTIITETYSNNSQAINAGKEQSTGMTGKLKNLFTASKESSTTEVQAQATPEQSSPESYDANKKVPGKVKNLLGKFKRK